MSSFHSKIWLNAFSGTHLKTSQRCGNNEVSVGECVSWESDNGININTACARPRNHSWDFNDSAGLKRILSYQTVSSTKHVALTTSPMVQCAYEHCETSGPGQIPCTHCMWRFNGKTNTGSWDYTPTNIETEHGVMGFWGDGVTVDDYYTMGHVMVGGWKP